MKTCQAWTDREKAVLNYTPELNTKWGGASLPSVFHQDLVSTGS